MLIAQLLVNALALGAAYALVALGFVLVLRATGAVNFAQGDLVMAGGYCAIALAAVLPLPGLALLPLVLVLMAVLGLALSAIAYHPLKDRPPVAVFISTIAVAIMLQNGANSLFGAVPRAGPPLMGGGVLEIGGLVLPRQSVVLVAVAALLIAGQGLLLSRTQLGRALRATAEDRDMARALGIRANRMIALTFALAAGFAGIAGMLLAPLYFVTPSEGTTLILKAYIAATIGGWGSLAGAVAGAPLIAAFEVLVSTAISHVAAEALLYGALLAILFLRPQGLFGEAAGRRA